MKKTNTSSTIIAALAATLSIGLLSGCATPKYTSDISYMSASQKEHEESILNEHLQKYAAAQTPEDKAAALEEVGFRYMVLGQLDESISYYEQLLEIDTVHYPALNNIVSMYEEMGEAKKALQYAERLFYNYVDNSQSLSLYIKLLVAEKDFIKAHDAVKRYSETETGKKYPEFVKEQQDYIQKAASRK